MNAISKLGLLAVLLLPASAAAQSRSASLAQALETFTAVDTNKDGKLSPEELVAAKLGLTRSDTRGIDFDHDGFWSKDEFLLFYRQRLLAADVKPAADLEAEATRILAARKAKTSERTPQRTAPEGHALADAVDELQGKAASGQAIGTDFDRVRDLMVADARSADQVAHGEDPALGEHSELQRQLLATLERLRSATLAGQFSREDFLDFRASIVKRARTAASAPGGDPELQSLGQALKDALDRLEQRGVAGNATREDFERVRDQLIARARAAAKGPNAPAAAEQELQSPLHTQMIQTLERLQAAAAGGTFSRDEYRAFRDSIVRRFRNAQEGTTQAQQPAPTADSDAELRSIEKRLTAALDSLEERAVAGNATREDFQRVRDQYIARARAAAKGATPASAGAADPEPVLQRELFQSLDRLEAAAKQGTFSREEYAQLRASMTHRAREAAAGTDDAGMNQAADELEKRVNGGAVNAADFAKLRGLVAARYQAASAKTDPSSVNEAALYQKLMQSLDRLEKAAQNGSVDRQEYQAFKDSFIHRARQIASSSQPPTGASGSAPVEQAGSTKRAGSQPARDANAKGDKVDPKSTPPVRPKPAPVEPERPQPPPPQQPPHRA